MSTSVRALKHSYKVTFEVEKDAVQNAKKILLISDFNGWDPITLEKGTKKKIGTFSKTIEINKDGAKNSYQYRFVYIMADGSEKYDNDWNAEAYAQNPFGSENSVFTLPVEKK